MLWLMYSLVLARHVGRARPIMFHGTVHNFPPQKKTNIVLLDHGYVWACVPACVSANCEAACLSVSTPQSIKPNMKGIRRVIFLTWVPSVRSHAPLCAVSFFKSIQISLSTNSASMWRRRRATAPPKYFAFFFAEPTNRPFRITFVRYSNTRHLPLSLFTFFATKEPVHHYLNMMNG